MELKAPFPSQDLPLDLPSLHRVLGTPWTVYAKHSGVEHAFPGVSLSEVEGRHHQEVVQSACLLRFLQVCHRILPSLLQQQQSAGDDWKAMVEEIAKLSTNVSQASSKASSHGQASSHGRSTLRPNTTPNYRQQFTNALRLDPRLSSQSSTTTSQSGDEDATNNSETAMREMWRWYRSVVRPQQFLYFENRLTQEQRVEGLVRLWTYRDAVDYKSWQHIPALLCADTYRYKHTGFLAFPFHFEPAGMSYGGVRMWNTWRYCI